MIKTYLININKKIISSKTKLIEIDEKLTYLTNEVAPISEKGHDFCYVECIL